MSEQNMKNLKLPESVQPLFNALVIEGKKVKSITFMAGTVNKDNPEHDLTIKGVEFNNMENRDSYNCLLNCTFEQGEGKLLPTGENNPDKLVGVFTSWVRDFTL